MPTLTAAALPIDKGIMKNKPPKVRAIPFAAITSLPNLPKIIPAPLNMLSSIKFPRPTGIPPTRISLSFCRLGISNLEKSSVPKADLYFKYKISKINVVQVPITAERPAPLAPISGNPKLP